MYIDKHEHKLRIWIPTVRAIFRPSIYPTDVNNLSAVSGAVNLNTVQNLEFLEYSSYGYSHKTVLKSKLMRIELSNRKWHFLRLLCIARLPTITVFIRHSIFEIDDVLCIILDYFYDYIRICML